jgi:hypothetical protein
VGLVPTPSIRLADWCSTITRAPQASLSGETTRFELNPG